MTVLKVNDPVSRSIDGLFKDIFNDFPAAFGKSVREDVLLFPPVNITEKTDAYAIEIAAPGFEKKDFKVKLDDKLLTIMTEKTEEKKENTDKLIRREFSHRSFKRSFTLDEKIDAEKISARYENGILFLDLPKKADLKTGIKEISIL